MCLLIHMSPSTNTVHRLHNFHRESHGRQMRTAGYPGTAACRAQSTRRPPAGGARVRRRARRCPRLCQSRLQCRGQGHRCKPKLQPQWHCALWHARLRDAGALPRQRRPRAPALCPFRCPGRAALRLVWHMRSLSLLQLPPHYELNRQRWLLRLPPPLPASMSACDAGSWQRRCSMQRGKTRRHLL